MSDLNTAEELPTEEIENPEIEGEQEELADQAPEVEEVEVVLEGDDDTQSLPDIPVNSFLKQKSKWKAKNEAQGQDLAAKDKEIELLKMQLNINNKPQSLTLPTLEQFDYDDDKFNAAKAAYDKQVMDAAITEKLNAYQSTSNQTVQQQTQSKQWDESLDAHLKKVAELKVSASITTFSVSS